jgi:hypothetical protein
MLGQGKNARPRDPVSLAPAAESTPPLRKHPIPERPQAREVSWHRVVIEVALDDRPQPSSGLGQRIMHAHPKLLLDLSQLASHAFADRFAPYHESAKTVLPADVRLSRPAGFHHQPLVEPSVKLSPHSAPIKQTRQSSRSASVQKDPRIPLQAVGGTDSLGFCGV